MFDNWYNASNHFLVLRNIHRSCPWSWPQHVQARSGLKMPAVLFSGEIGNKLPPGLTSIDIKTLTPHIDLVNKYVHATIHHICKHNKKPFSSIKMVLRNNEGSVIDLLALGQVADDLGICVQGDILIFLKFEVEACPGHHKQACQLIVDDTGDIGSLVWICKKNNMNKTTLQSKPDQSTSKQRSYSYKPLSELKVNTINDVYGVVKFYKPPTKTRGSDYCCTISLTDPSFGSPEDKLSCNIFSYNESHLPHLEVGNIIRFHRLKTQTYQGKMQGYNGPGFQWLLFRGSVDHQEASTSSYTFEQHDEDKVKSLLEWWQKKADTILTIRDSKKLAEVQPKDYFDLICQVIRICDLEVKTCKVCRVWDGTKFEGQLKMSKEEEFSSSVQEDGTLMAVAADLAVDVYLFDNHVIPAGIIRPGDFIQLSNLHAAVVSGQIELTLHGGTQFNRGVAVLSRDSPQVRQIESVLNTVVKNKTSSNLLVKENDAVHSMHRQTLASNEKLINRSTDVIDIQVASSGNAQRKGTIEEQGSLTRSNTKLNDVTVMTVQCKLSENMNFKNQLTAVSDIEKSGSTSRVRQKQVFSPDRQRLDTIIGICGKEKSMTSNVHVGDIIDDPLEISSDSSQSLWLSADADSEPECQFKKDLASKVDHGQLQDSNISSSGTVADSQDLLSTSAEQALAVSDNLSQACSIGVNKNVEQSSQESFCTAYSSNVQEATVAQPCTSVTGSSQKAYLSLKRKPDLQDEPDDNDLGLAAKKHVFSQNSNLLCLETVEFTDTSPAINAQEMVVAETEADIALDLLWQQNTFQHSDYDHIHTEPTSIFTDTLGENICKHIDNSLVANSAESRTFCEVPDKLFRCRPQIVSKIVSHPLVLRTSLKDVLEHAVPYKFRVLVRVQDLKPNPVRAVDLVHFICSHCHYIESAASAKVPLTGQFLEHVCPNSIQSVKLKPTFIITFVLTDGKHSLIAYLCGKLAVEFFCGIEPIQLLSSDKCFHQVQEYLESLCPQNSKIEDRPMLECCLFSYGTGGSVKYQIFDTRLVEHHILATNSSSYKSSQ